MHTVTSRARMRLAPHPAVQWGIRASFERVREGAMSHIAAAGELLSAASYMSKRNFSGIGGVLTALMTSAAFFASPQALAQSSPAQGVTIPSVTVTAPEAQRRTNPSSAVRRSSGTRSRRTQTARRPETTAAPQPFAPSQDARTGTVGYFANSTSVATKSNTPIVNIPQSLSVITQRADPRPELPGPDRRHALCPERRRPPGRRQSRRARHPRRRFQRELLRQRLS